jgi:cobalt/nickel transport system permease protein
MDELGRMDSLIHRLDARAQVVTTLLFVVTVMSFSRYEVVGLIPLLAYPLFILVAGGLPIGFLSRKVALAAPFALLVGLFNPWLDPHRVLLPGGHEVAAGWFSFISILLRCVMTVLAGLALLACTGIFRLCAGLERLGAPRVFAVQLLFLHRYFFVIGDEGIRIKRGVELRSGALSGLGLRTYGHLAGHLLVRSLDRAQRIYQAMVARGFDGTIRVASPDRWTWRETLFVGGWSVFFILARTGL